MGITSPVPYSSSTRFNPATSDRDRMLTHIKDTTSEHVALGISDRDQPLLQPLARMPQEVPLHLTKRLHSAIEIAPVRNTDHQDP